MLNKVVAKTYQIQSKNSNFRREMDKRHSTHRDLKSDSHKRFGTRDFAFWAYILGYGESKKDCLNSCRNRSAHCRPSRDSNPGPLKEQLLD